LEELDYIIIIYPPWDPEPANEVASVDCLLEPCEVVDAAVLEMSASKVSAHPVCMKRMFWYKQIGPSRGLVHEKHNLQWGW
jgi:hypothetical protein